MKIMTDEFIKAIKHVYKLNTQINLLKTERDDFIIDECRKMGISYREFNRVYEEFNLTKIKKEIIKIVKTNPAT